MSTYLYFYITVLLLIGLNVVAWKHAKRRWLLWAIQASSAFSLILFMWTATDPQESQRFYDFTKAYYPAGRVVAEDPSKLYERSSECAEDSICNFVNIPIVAYAFTPLSFLSLSNAHVALAFLSALCVVMALSYTVMVTQASGWRRFAILFLFAGNGPLYYSIQEGNLTHFVLLLLVVAIACWQSGREAWSGLLLAVAAVIKVPLLLLGIFFVLRRRWRGLAGFAATLMTLGGASVLLTGVEPHLAWYRESVQPFAHAALGAFNVQSIDGFLMRLRDGADLYNWTPVAVGWKFKALRNTLTMMLLCGSLWICLRPQSEKSVGIEYVDFSILLCLALLISPVSWTHYYVFLLLPLCFYLGNLRHVRSGQRWESLLLISAALLSPPVVVIDHHNSILGSSVAKVFVSHYLFGGLPLLGVLLVHRWKMSQPYRLMRPERLIAACLSKLNPLIGAQQKGA
jgi:hypothetical protein